MAGSFISVIFFLGAFQFGMIKCQQCSVSVQNQTQVQKLANGNLNFALNLYKGLSENTNLFFSPFSISVALGMVLAGAKGNTFSQMKTTLNLNEFANDDSINNAYQVVLNSICSNSNYTLSTANKIFTQKNFPIIQSYLNILTNDFKSSAENVDFASNPDAVAQQINSWVEQQTNNNIKNLFPVGSLSRATIMVLVNAIYFKGVWQTKFDTAKTKPENFTLSNGQIVSTSIMNAEAKFYYAQNSQLKCKILKLDYAGQRLAMFAILPDQADGLSTLRNQLSSENFNSLIKSLGNIKVKVKLPSFKLNFKKELNELLQKLGMIDVFSPSSANLTGISDPQNGQLSVSKVIHQAFVEVDEKGTTAAAATGVSISKMTAVVFPPPLVAEFYAVHSFIFCIYDTETELILFMGNLDNPANA